MQLHHQSGQAFAAFLASKHLFGKFNEFCDDLCGSDGAVPEIQQKNIQCGKAHFKAIGFKEAEYD